MIGGRVCLRLAPWSGCPAFRQGVTLRRPDREEPVLAALAEGLRPEGFGRVVRLRQVHGARVLRVPGPLGECSPEGFPLADGLACASPGVLGAVTVADCVPVFLLAPRRRAWALLHAGWRGIAAGILGAGLAALEQLGAAPEELQLYLGPAICGSCYEVGPEVVAALRAGLSSGNSLPGPGESRARIDLRGLLAGEAASRGVPPAAIMASSFCTRCHNHLFHSYRAEGPVTRERMWAFIGFRE